MTLGVDSVNFCAFDFGAAFFNSFCCVPGVLLVTLGVRCTLFIFCAKAALLAKRTAACDMAEISDTFDRSMSQQYCEWIRGKVDERHCLTGVPSLAQTIRSLQTWWLQPVDP